MNTSRQKQSRRTFLKTAATATAALSSSGLFRVQANPGNAQIGIVVDRNDPLLMSAPVQWAIGQMREALSERGISTIVYQTIREAPPAREPILVESFAAARSRRRLEQAGLPRVPESLALVPLNTEGRRIVLASGADDRGLVYALLEVADRVRLAQNPLEELRATKRTIQQPANKIRSIARLFASEVEDKAWFNDRDFWQRYLSELATHRFNRFNLTLGLGYDFPTDIRDAYLHFAYPFLLAVPGYDVRAVPLADAERDRNLEMLRFISDETARRGLHFQLGLWTHAYKWVDSPHANYTIEGLTPETHGAYCRDALATLLNACPNIHGITLRIHGESGIAEGSYDFWQAVFDGAVRSGRRVELDLHAKGIDDKMIDLALATGMPVNVAPKFWAEHMGLGYMQGAIRPQEMPPVGQQDKGFFSRSSGSRRFLRYGYGDLLREDRRYGVLHRIWPGTQRLLLWADPALAADYGRASSFCGSLGVEWLEPLSFKGRKGSGFPGGRNGYADPSLVPIGGDFEKYQYSYRVWGRHIYDPNCDPAEWRRALRSKFGVEAATPVEAALAQSSKILPLITTAHCPSAANNNYWPEMYTNMAIVDAHRPSPYSDTPSPKRFGTVTPLDPEFFSSVEEFAHELLGGEPSGKYSPAWVAATLEQAADASDSSLLVSARAKAADPQTPEFRRMAADVKIQSGIGRFFAWKFRAATFFAIYERSKYWPALRHAVEAYHNARLAWSTFAVSARGVYRDDITFGPGKFQRGHWADRLAAIDDDIADMEKLLAKEDAMPAAHHSRDVSAALAVLIKTSTSEHIPTLSNFHLPPESFRHGQPLQIECSLAHSKSLKAPVSIRLRFRRVNQSEIWQSQPMEANGKTFRTNIAGPYTDSPFPLQYHFQLRAASGQARLFPGLNQRSQGQPYFTVRQVS